MSAMDHPTLLTRLIMASERALQMRFESERDSLHDLHLRLVAEHEAPSEGSRVIGADILLCADAALYADRELRGYDRRRAAPFLRVIGVLLPEVRSALELALEHRKRPTP